MDLPNILNTRGGNGMAMSNSMAHAMPNAQHFQQYPMSDTGSERGLSPHLSERGQYGRPVGQLQAFNLAQPSHQQLSMNSNPYPTPTESIENGYAHNQDDQLHTPTSEGQASQVKAFACSTCAKGFARRSDLARHERIHTGVRPHQCEHPGCGKQFIQRSALTVHTRVHTGEKPHMCEHCTKPFSDSSSLARHRRIHSGKRPYKCPYVNCQKTFTRRTTLTRHQAHHTGTVEESKAQADAVLAQRPFQQIPQHQPARIKTEVGPFAALKAEQSAFSDAGSSRSSPSSDRHMTNVQATPDMSQTHMMPRQADFSYMGGLPPHLRHDLSQNSPRSGSASPALSGYAMAGRPSFTSNPVGYAAPPPPLEPPTHTQNEHRAAGSHGGSPHLSSLGWQTPPNGNMGSPMAPAGYTYPDQAYDLNGNTIYYANQTHSRPQSTQPDQYGDMKHRMAANEVWGNQMPGQMS